jgi:hypothetical protein
VDNELIVRNILAHHGVKGMKWGVRKSGGSRESTQARVDATVSRTGKAKLKSSGGSGWKAHPDAVSAHAIKQVLKKSGTHALSNQELQQLNTRLNLEQQTARLTGSTHGNGKQFVTKLLMNIGEQSAKKVAAQKLDATFK